MQVFVEKYKKLFGGYSFYLELCWIEIKVKYSTDIEIWHGRIYIKQSKEELS